MKRSVASGRGPNIINTVTVYCVHRSPEFYIEEKWQNHQERNENDQQKPGEEQCEKGVKNTKELPEVSATVLRFVKRYIQTASKVKCEAWTREWEKRKSSRVQDVSKMHGTYSPAGTITLWNWIPEQKVFALLSWSGIPGHAFVIWTLLTSTATASASQQRKKP